MDVFAVVFSTVLEDGGATGTLKINFLLDFLKIPENPVKPSYVPFVVHSTKIYIESLIFRRTRFARLSIRFNFQFFESLILAQDERWRRG